jgi:hypothetical protein
MQNVIDLILQKGFQSNGQTEKWYGNWKPVLNIRKRFVFHSNHRMRVTVGKLTTYFYIACKGGRIVPASKFKTRNVEGIKNYLNGSSSY